MNVWQHQNGRFKYCQRNVHNQAIMCVFCYFKKSGYYNTYIILVNVEYAKSSLFVDSILLEFTCTLYIKNPINTSVFIHVT